MLNSVVDAFYTLFHLPPIKTYEASNAVFMFRPDDGKPDDRNGIYNSNNDPKYTTNK